MKILVTGTNVTTALAVIEELRKYIDIQIVYVGRKTTREGDISRSVESQILPKIGVKFIPIIAGRLQFAFTIYTIPSLLKLPIGFIQAFWIILKEEPDVVLSFGGYVGVPAILAAWLLSKRVIIHEGSLVTGLANKISLLFADKVAVSFEESSLSKNPKAVLTGNPIREGITRSVNVRHSGSELGRHLGIPSILITGGNQGSHVINLAVEGCLDKILKLANVIHQTGDSKYRDYERLSRMENEKYRVFKWIDNMGDMMKKVNLVVSRAGINTLSELAYFGKPALVIPIPYLYQDEQQKNAKYFEKLGLVKILPQSKLNTETLLKSIKSCLNDLNHLNKAAQKAKGVIIPDAAKRLALETILLGKR